MDIAHMSVRRDRSLAVPCGDYFMNHVKDPVWGEVGGRGSCCRYGPVGDNAFATTRSVPQQHGSSATRNGSRRCRRANTPELWI
eukprot:3406343-Prymnesium_polylepis.1